MFSKSIDLVKFVKNLQKVCNQNFITAKPVDTIAKRETQIYSDLVTGL